MNLAVGLLSIDARLERPLAQKESSRCPACSLSLLLLHPSLLPDPRKNVDSSIRGKARSRPLGEDNSTCVWGLGRSQGGNILASEGSGEEPGFNALQTASPRWRDGNRKALGKSPRATRWEGGLETQGPAVLR